MSHVSAMTLGQRSMSQFILTVCEQASYVQPISSSHMVGFGNYLAQIIIKTRQFVLCKIHVAKLKIKFTARSPHLQFVHRLH